MGNWLHANGARIRACTDAAERERLTALQRQREPVYDAVFAGWWQAWAAESPAGPVSCDSDAPAADPDAEYRATVGRLAEEDRLKHPAPDQTLYQLVTGEPLDTAVARFRAETEAAKGVNNKG